MKARVSYKDTFTDDIFGNVSTVKEVIDLALSKMKTLKPNITFPTRISTVVIRDDGACTGNFIETIDNYLEFIDDIEFFDDEVYVVMDYQYGSIDAIFSDQEGAEDWIKQLTEEGLNTEDLFIDKTPVDPDVEEYLADI